MNDNKTAVITGGSRGIGRAIALKLASNGFDIAIICASNEERAKSVCAEISSLGADSRYYLCDVSDFMNCKKTVAQIIKDFGKINVLINNAGITSDNLIFSMTEEHWDSVIDVNLKGTFNMIKHCSPVFLKQKQGKIVNISSVAGLIGNPGQCNYAASKAGIIGLTKSIARELAGRGICCNAIAPGIIDTEMTSKQELRDNIIKKVPLNRIGNPEDIAQAALFLSTQASDYITGIVLPVDGGLGM